MATSITSGQKKQYLRFAEDAAEKALEQCNISQDGMQRLIANGGTFQKHLITSIREFFIANQLGNETYRLTIDYGQPLSEMISAGHYDWISDNITDKNFPIQGGGVVELDATLVHFNRTIGTDNALKELYRMGYRPATLPELLAFGRQYPELQQQYPIIALGSVWQVPNGYRIVACLDASAGLRSLNLDGSASDWLGVCRFLAVRK